MNYNDTSTWIYDNVKDFQNLLEPKKIKKLDNNEDAFCDISVSLNIHSGAWDWSGDVEGR